MENQKTTLSLEAKKRYVKINTQVTLDRLVNIQRKARSEQEVCENVKGVCFLWL